MSQPQTQTPKTSTASSSSSSSATTTTSSSVSKLCIEDIDIDAGYYLHRTKLGEGGFSKVKLATHLRTNEKAAIKCMDKVKLGEDLFRVQTEIRALKVLQHENIAKLLQVIETHDKIYLILEYCSGGELFDYIVSKARLSERESQQIMRSLIQVLAFLHANGFAHRDLKPENILFDGNHNIKLIDFGLAANSNEKTSGLSHLQTCCGSPAYAAPELIAGDVYSGPAVDVWSAGVLMYTLLVGQLPFDDDNLTNLYKKIQSGKYKLPVWLSTQARDVITRMLQLNPNKRITIQELLRHPWITQGKSENESLKIQKHHLSEEILWECHKLFPEVPINELRHSILHRFGIHTATYWLLHGKNKVKMSTPNKPIIPPRLTKSAENTLNVTCTKEIDQQGTPNSKSAELLTDKENENRPRLLAAKRKCNPDEWIKFDDSLSNDNRKINTNGATPTKTVPLPRPPNSPLAITPLVASPKRAIPVPIKKLPMSPNTTAPASPARVAAVGHVAPIKKPKLDVDVDNSPSIKSPLRDMKGVENIVPKPSFGTPIKQKFEATPKKSLLKRILETATPSKAQQPRLVTAAAPKNITSTLYTDPQLCIQKLMDALSAKGIACKRKEFLLCCSYSNKYTKNILTFNLEICKFNDLCVIQRKRLRGDSWHYKRICEEVLRISNASATANEAI